jgi:hypothetical protein
VDLECRRSMTSGESRERETSSGICYDDIEVICGYTLFEITDY